MIHLKRNTSRIFSLNLTPKLCVLVLNSICLRSFESGLGGDFPKMVNKPPAIKLTNEFIFVLTCMIEVRGFQKANFYFLSNGKSIFVPLILSQPLIPHRFCLSIWIRQTFDICPEFQAWYHNIFALHRFRLRQHCRFCIVRPKAMS